MSRRVLIAWEFGSGLGHLGSLYTIVRALRSRGCEPLVTVPELEFAREVLGPEAPRLVSSVPLPNPRLRLPPPASFADLLLQRGFSSLTTLETAVRGWQSLFRRERIESVVLDYAPVAQLAAWTMGLPMASYSIGFANPPLPLPCFRPGNAQAERATRLAEQFLLNNVEYIANRFGMSTQGNIASWLRAPYTCIRGIRETDVYGREPEGGFVGPLGDLPCMEQMEWSGDREERVLCYLRWTPRLPRIIKAIAGSDREVVCVIPRAPAEWVSRTQQPGVRITTRRVDIPHLIGGATLVVSHASGGVASHALIAGKPQVLFPIDWEKALIARRLEKLAVGSYIERLPRPGEPLIERRHLEELAATARHCASGLRPEEWRMNFDGFVASL